MLRTKEDKGGGDFYVLKQKEEKDERTSSAWKIPRGEYGGLSSPPHLDRSS